MSVKVVPFITWHCLGSFLDYHITNEGQNTKGAILGAIIKNDHNLLSYQPLEFEIFVID